MTAAVSPLAPPRFPDIPPIDGLRMAIGEAGVKYRHRTDVLLAACAPGSTVGGVLTRSRTRAAPVDWCARALRGGRAAGIVVNSGNANAFTGRAGEAAARETARCAAGLLGATEEEILIASTGVIGAPLPVERITAVLPGMTAALRPGGWEAAARAIMTTDTFPKGAFAVARIGDKQVKLAGIAKGSGMIAPDMATMLAFLFTDARIPAPVLQQLTVRAADISFNCVTVDGDTSTSDSFLLTATGAADNPQPESADDPLLEDFRRALETVCVDLARQIAGDGEGAQKRITVDVSGARDDGAARRIGLAIAGSPLVKTAIAGGDANWGRIVMAVGKAGEEADRDRLQIRIGGVLAATEGFEAPGYDEAAAARHLAGREVAIAVDVGVGDGRARVWGCDLTDAYVAINADYRS